LHGRCKGFESWWRRSPPSEGLSLASRLLLRVGLVLRSLAFTTFTALLAAGPEPAALDLSRLPSEAELAEVVWKHGPDLVAARTRLGLAAADVTRTELLPNPTFDFQWGTIPLGPTNPPGLNKLADVPNYTFALSELVELGKRGPRQSASQAARQAAALDLIELLRQRWLDLLERIAEVAAAQLRVAAVEETVADTQRLALLQRERQSRGDIAGLDVDRSELEAEKFLSNLGEEQEKLSAALLLCSQAAGLICRPFASAETARSYLGARLGTTAAPASIDARPDLRSLEAQEAAARSSLTLARRRWIPDPTVRAGYVLDEFTVAGNQHQSFFVGLSFPLTFFDHGQADARAAGASAEGAARARLLLRAQSTRDLTSLDQQRANALARRTRLQERTLPLARDVVQRLESAVTRGGAPLPDLLLARRTLGELQLDAADLDLFSFHLSVARARSAGEVPPLPEDAPYVP
jgi:cobalt-zinc-cadmium efflux system outer membrane protein